MKKGCLLGRLLLGVLILSLAGVGTKPVLGSTPAINEPPRSKYETWGQPPLTPEVPPLADTYSITSTVASPTAPGLTWSRVAFESYRDNNWEIYASNDDASGLVRLTNHSAVDIQPRFNRGATRVAFASNRTGNYEVFTINADGSELTQLTFTPTDDVYPAWSPDGTRLAFQSYRDGQAEIYVMQADGSNAVRLTFNTDATNGNAYDAQPAWSPDGTRLAFVSKRTGGYRIWVMGVDGSAPVQLSSQLYSASPIWSPNGAQILYGADDNGDGWQELWWMAADGSNPTLRLSAATVDYLPGGWAPDGQYSAHTEVMYLQVNGTWYVWQTAMIATHLASYTRTMLGNNQAREFSLDWQTTDAASPQSQVAALPEYSHLSDSQIAWSGTDQGPSGLATYDVQYRVSEQGTWTNWLTATTTTQASFSPVAGTTVYFRSRAHDNSFNTEPWPPSTAGDAHTTFYTWSVVGEVRDARDNPVVNAIVSSVVPFIHPAITNADGAFRAYLTVTGTTPITVAKTGYGLLPSVATNLVTDATIVEWLPPADNQVINGEFETGDLAGWLVTGVVTPTLTHQAAHSGQWGAWVGQSPPYAIPEQIFAGDSPAQAYDSLGQLHMAWHNPPSQYDEGWINYTVCSSDSQCLPTQAVVTGTSPHLDIGPDNIVHLIWTQNTTQIMYAQRTLTDTWTSSRQIASSEEWYAGTAALKVDNAGTPHVVWNNYRAIYYSQRSLDGTWITPERASGVCCGIQPDIAIDAFGAVHVVWSPGTTMAPEGYNIRAPGGGWGVPLAISPDMYYSNPPTIALDSHGTAYVAWQEFDLGQYFDGQSLHFRYRLPSGVWSPIATLNSTSQTPPQLLVTPDDHVVLTWGHYTTWNSPVLLVYSYFRDDGSWSTPRQPFGQSVINSPDVSVAADPTSRRLSVATSGVFFNQFEFAPEKSDLAQITQVLTVPASLHQPTLSVLFNYFTEDPQGKDPFILQVTDAATTTLLSAPIITSTPGWQHAWLDMSPWQGQLITITAQLSTTADDLYSYAYVDEISLGSWQTPLIQAVSPTHVDDLSSLPATFVITGQNFITTPVVYIGQTLAPNVLWLSDTQLQAEIPAGLNASVYSVRVVNPGGPESVKPNVLWLGRFLFLPLISR